MVKQRLEAAMMPAATRMAEFLSSRRSTTNPASGGPARAAVPLVKDNKPKPRLREWRPGGGGGESRELLRVVRG